jgi:hypothetical protein
MQTQDVAQALTYIYCVFIEHSSLKQHKATNNGQGVHTFALSTAKAGVTEKHFITITVDTAASISQIPFLNAFPKLRKANVSFVMSVRLSGRPHGTPPLPTNVFS